MKEVSHDEVKIRAALDELFLSFITIGTKHNVCPICLLFNFSVHTTFDIIQRDAETIDKIVYMSEMVTHRLLMIQLHKQMFSNLSDNEKETIH